MPINHNNTPDASIFDSYSTDVVCELNEHLVPTMTILVKIVY